MAHKQRKNSRKPRKLSKVETRNLAETLSRILCGSRKYPDPHHGGNWKFQGGGGVLSEIPSVVGVWIFSGTTHYCLTTRAKRNINYHTCLIYTNGYDSSNWWSIGTNGSIGTKRKGHVIPMVLLVNMHLIKGTGPFWWSIGTNATIGTNGKAPYSNGSIG